MLLISPKEGLYFQMTYIKDYCESRKNFPLVKVGAFSCDENDLSFGDSQLQCHIKQALAKICLVAGSLTVTDLWVKPMMLFLPQAQVLGSSSGVFIVHIASYMSELFQLFSVVWVHQEQVYVLACRQHVCLRVLWQVLSQEGFLFIWPDIKNNLFSILGNQTPAAEQTREPSATVRFLKESARRVSLPSQPVCTR